MTVLTKFGYLSCSSCTWWLDGDHSYMTCLQLWVTSTTTTMHCLNLFPQCIVLSQPKIPWLSCSCESWTSHAM